MRILTVVVMGMLLFGCGRDLTGMYTGNGTITRGQTGPQEQITIQLTDTSGTLSGTWTSVTNGSSGQITGTADGDTITSLTFMIPEGGQNCSGTLTGSGSFANYLLTLTMSGSTKCGQISTSITLTQHPQ